MQKLTNDFIKELNANKTWLKLSGIVLCFFGFLIILGSFFYFPVLTSINLIIVSIILFVHAFKFWLKKPYGFLIYLIESLTYLFMGVFFLQHFILRVYVPLLLICAFFVFGCFRLYSGLYQLFIYPGWSGTVLSGAVTLVSIAGIYYFFNNIEAKEIILVLGINILFVGISFMALGFGFNRLNFSSKP